MHSYTVIGITDMPCQYLAPEVAEIVSRGHFFSGGRRQHTLVEPLLPQGYVWTDITVPVSDVIAAYEAIPGNDEIIIFASGDPLFYGFAVTLKRLLPKAGIRVFPAFNSLQMLAHRLLLPYHDLRAVSLTGRPWQEFDRALIEHATMIGVLTDRSHTPDAIARRMIEYGYIYYTMHVGQHLGNPDSECVLTMSLKEAARREFQMPNCVIVEAIPQDKMTAQQFDAWMSRSFFGIDDSQFLKLDGRENMITKMPIRLLALHELELPRRHVLWDIGACTGSVSIEARLRFPHLQVEAFEIRDECESIILKNARALGCPGISLHIGDFLTANFDDIPKPDAVFIGGHGGCLHDIMVVVNRYLKLRGCIVMNCVSSPIVDGMRGDRPGTRQLWQDACAALQLVDEVPTRVVIDNNNPIEILKCQKTLL